MTTKRRKRHSPEQIVRKLQNADAVLNAGRDVAVALQALALSGLVCFVAVRWKQRRSDRYG